MYPFHVVGFPLNVHSMFVFNYVLNGELADSVKDMFDPLYKINELKVKVYHMTQQQQHKRIRLSIEYTRKYSKEVSQLRIKLFFYFLYTIIKELDNTLKRYITKNIINFFVATISRKNSKKIT